MTIWSAKRTRSSYGRNQMQHAIRFFVSSLCMIFMLPCFASDRYVPGSAVPGSFESFAEPFLNEHCLDCHSGSEPEAGLSLDTLGAMNEANATTWRSIWAQVSLQEMPPEEAEQPPVSNRLRFRDWVVHNLDETMMESGGFRAHRDPTKGNFIAHDLLFGPLPDDIELEPTFSPARLWRVTPQEHITRLNELINTEPAYDANKPGLRTHGDEVPTNHGGELKLYFGTDRIIQWQGGTVAYATAVKSIPSVLSSAREHGFENYPDLYSVNSAEATQLLSTASDILRYMAYGPLSIAAPQQITDNPAAYFKKYVPGDNRGLPSSLVYSTKTVRPLTPVIAAIDTPSATDDCLRKAVNYLFEALTFRPPQPSESDRYVTIVKNSVHKLGQKDGAVLGLSAIFLDRDALFRPELVEYGTPDSFGRIMLQDWELGLAVNHALRYIKPDEDLKRSVLNGAMRTRDDVQREVQRMLADDSIRKPRILQFFREYFDYDQGGYICKDTRSLITTGINGKTRGRHYHSMFEASASTDRLIELMLKEDRDVLRQLLTTQKVIVTKNDSEYFGQPRTKAARVALQKEVKKAAEKQKLQEEAERNAWKAANPGKEPPKKKNRRQTPTINVYVEEAPFEGTDIFARVSHRSFGAGSLSPKRMLTQAPEGQRLGVLTHPSWLVSHSDAMDNHAIRRGRWIQERLLGGGIPDVPITVDAMLPDAPTKTLRERMEVTKQDYCWTCHQKMDPLGLPFEMYNHAGLFRTSELERPVDTTGEIIHSGDENLDGPVENALDLIQRLATSERAEQVFVRHAFRFWMGRNETLHDRVVLQDAHEAYKSSGGSMKALLTSLLTSDAFLYRKPEQNRSP